MAQRLRRAAELAAAVSHAGANPWPPQRPRCRSTGLPPASALGAAAQSRRLAGAGTPASRGQARPPDPARAAHARRAGERCQQPLPSQHLVDSGDAAGETVVRSKIAALASVSWAATASRSASTCPDRGPVLERLHTKFLPEHGLAPTVHHHEIYLSDPRRTQPAKLKTILRQPVKAATTATAPH